MSNANETFLGSCRKAKADLGLNSYCCSSCHEDEPLGYPLSEIHVDNGWYSVCCATQDAHQGEPR